MSAVERQQAAEQGAREGGLCVSVCELCNRAGDGDDHAGDGSCPSTGVMKELICRSGFFSGR
ncbi:hypothetical protein Dimus_002871 [Dionaea muscipula]